MMVIINTHYGLWQKVKKKVLMDFAIQEIQAKIFGYRCFDRTQNEDKRMWEKKEEKEHNIGSQINK